MVDNRKQFDTRIIHNGRDPSRQGAMVNPPVYHGSTVVFDSLADLRRVKDGHVEKDTLVYGLTGSLSTFAFENAVADLENGYGGLSASSGLAAVTTAILAYVNSGDHLLMADTVYGPTRRFCDQFLRRMNVDVTYYDPLLGGAIEELVQNNTRLIYMESPGSNTFETQDVPAIVDVAKQRGIVTVLDNSWATPLFFRPLDFGVNVSVIAATKYIVGHADALAGLIVTDESNYWPMKHCRDQFGHCLAPDDVYLGMRGLRTLSVRVRQHEQQALSLASWLQRHPDVETVLHPALPDCPGHEIWKRDFQGSTGLFSIVVPNRGERALAAMLDEMTLFAMGYSWGGFESLIVPQDPARMRTATTWDNPGQLLRIHAGLENIDDMIIDLEKGLHRYMST